MMRGNRAGGGRVHSGGLVRMQVDVGRDHGERRHRRRLLRIQENHVAVAVLADRLERWLRVSRLAGAVWVAVWIGMWVGVRIGV